MKTRAITKGGLMCAVAVLMALLCYYVPFFLILYIFIPLPIVVLAKRQGFLTALISAVAATGILFFLIDWMNAVSFAMYLILVGCSLGFSYDRKMSGAKRLGIGYAAVLVTVVVSIVLIQTVTGVRFIDSLVNDMSTAFNQMMEMYKSSSLLSADQLAALQSGTATMLSAVKMVLPLSILMMPALVSWLNICLCDKVLTRLKAEYTPLAPISQWRLPGSLKLFLLILVIGLTIVDFVGEDTIPVVYTYTLTEIVNLIYTLMGLSFCFWFFNRKRSTESPGIKILIVVLTFLIPFVSYALSLIGVADTYLRIRDIMMLNDKSKGGKDE